MKITLFTSNQNRHNYLINLLSKISDELFVVQECEKINPEQSLPSEIMSKYFEKVNEAQLELFGNSYVNNLKKNIRILPILSGDLNKCSLTFLSDFLKSDVYVVFGSSYIKGELVDYLIKRKAINIHMGVSPYYRGTDCNFWALYDNNPHLVGATIHMLSKGLDSGPILYHAMSNIRSSPFEYTMSTVKSAINSIVEKIKDKSIFKIETTKKNKLKKIRYSKKLEFNKTIIEKYFKKNINLKSKEFDNSLLINPYYLRD